MGVSRLCSRGVGGAVPRGARSCLNGRSEELIEQAGSNKTSSLSTKADDGWKPSQPRLIPLDVNARRNVRVKCWETGTPRWTWGPLPDLVDHLKVDGVTRDQEDGHRGDDSTESLERCGRERRLGDRRCGPGPGPLFAVKRDQIL